LTSAGNAISRKGKTGFSIPIDDRQKIHCDGKKIVLFEKVDH
jgi:hypothetical protein